MKYTIALVLVAILALPGCEGRENIERLERGIQRTEQVVANVETRIAYILDDIAALERQDNLTMEEQEMLLDLRDRLNDAEDYLVDANVYLAEATDVLENSQSDGDLLIEGIIAGAGALGIPYIGTIASLFRRRRQFNGLVANIDEARVGDSAIDFSLLAERNAEIPGLQPTIRKLRKA